VKAQLHSEVGSDQKVSASCVCRFLGNLTMKMSLIFPRLSLSKANSRDMILFMASEGTICSQDSKHNGDDDKNDQDCQN